ncbi:FMN-linked oxidoreductase [Nadsonia fulvescens var. elongata DSM 6958]|uniref:FMN-linked oxidoreductase n=1 Tax=Nadsonia fulvescens var. elongata DSM 6958 TaxID=857566 RepID=A0A1E3PLI3_9ASCO|nr:FMN-linked oxidoreductase [Nadsonia fulvescens var. elongata DSM 6958]
MVNYRGALVLAPMVRISELPMRLMSLKYGADLVWGPEIVDKKIIQCERIWNEKIKCTEFIHKESKVNSVVFRTAPAFEKGKLIFQMGTADPVLAVQAAKVVAADVDGIDVNSGCPKHFSIHSGMGAALLRKPDVLESILRALVTEVGIPFDVSISVKIRILETEEETLTLVRRLVKTGIKCLTVHCRTTPMRPREAVIRDSLSKIADLCRESGVACLVNGDVQGRWELEELIQKYGVDGAMIARAAEANPSCFRKEGIIPWEEVIKEFLTCSTQYDNFISNIKYCLLKMIPGKSETFRPIAQSRTVDQMIGHLNMNSEMPAPNSTTLEPAQKTEERKTNDSQNIAKAENITEVKKSTENKKGNEISSLKTDNAEIFPPSLKRQRNTTPEINISLKRQDIEAKS